MAALYVIIAILAGAVIILFIQSREKPKNLEKEISRLRKAIIAGGLNFEQIEHRITGLKNDIKKKKETISSGKVKESQIVEYMEEMEMSLDGILEELLSGRTMK